LLEKTGGKSGSFVERINLSQLFRIDPDQHAAAVVGIALPPDHARLFQTVEHRRDAPGSQAGRLGQPARRNGSEEIQKIDALHVRQVQPYVVRHFLVEENCAGDEPPNLGDQLRVQGTTSLH
jgi:hypothetical protein